MTPSSTAQGTPWFRILFGIRLRTLERTPAPLERLQKGLRRAFVAAGGPALSAVAGAVFRDCRKGCGARCRRFFFARVRALCVPRGTSHHDEFEWAVRGMSLTRTTSRTKPNPKPNTTPSKTTNKPETKGSGSSPYESKRAKGADPRTNTVVKRGNEFISSRSQWRTSRAKLHSNAICVWAGVYSFSGAQRAEMPEHTESESKVQFRFD